MLIQIVSESFFINLFWRNGRLDLFTPPFSSLLKNFKDIWVPNFNQDRKSNRDQIYPPTWNNKALGNTWNGFQDIRYESVSKKDPWENENKWG